MRKAFSTSALRPWISDSLKFNCTRCGKCCKGRTNVFINETEGTNIAQYLNITTTQFYQKFTNEVDLPSGESLTSLTSKPRKTECIFLVDNKCSIYEVRPTQCRTYPFWPSIILGKVEWENEKRVCEGIDNTAHDSVPVSIPDIMRNVIIHQVHNRGQGENFDYDHAREYLQECENTEETLISDFQQEFFNLHSSETLFEDDSLRIVDMKLPKADNPSISVHDEGLDDNDENTPTETFRRLEFKNSVNMTQTEVLLSSVDSSVDHSQLILPVHRALFEVTRQTVEFYRDINQQVNQPSQPAGIRMLVIGAGGHALSSHILYSAYKYGWLLELDNVEPYEALIELSKTYFHADTSRTYPTTGEEYLRKCTQDNLKYDVIIIDAFDDCDVHSSDNDIRAPPLSFLDHRLVDDLRNISIAENSKAIVLINIYGTMDWAKSIRKAYTTDIMTADLIRLESSTGDNHSRSNYILVVKNGMHPDHLKIQNIIIPSLDISVVA